MEKKKGPQRGQLKQKRKRERREVDGVVEVKCHMCEVYKTTEKFVPCKERADGIQTICRDCRRRRKTYGKRYIPNVDDSNELLDFIAVRYSRVMAKDIVGEIRRLVLAATNYYHVCSAEALLIVLAQWRDTQHFVDETDLITFLGD